MSGSSSSPRLAFTRLELLVLVLLLVVIALAIVPLFPTRTDRTLRMWPAMKNAQSITQSLTLYASEHGGLFPTGTTSSNEAFRKLFPSACDLEEIFWLKGDSIFCDSKTPDEDISEGKVLEPGENHWAYVSGLDLDAPANTPVVMDGFTAPAYRYDKNHVWWKPCRAIVAFVDGSVRMVKTRDGVLVFWDLEGDNYVPIEQLPSLRGKTILNPERPPSKP